AIAVHIHSFSAATLRNPAAGWCGPLVEHGAAVTMGNVYEPYLTLTPQLDVFQDRLMAGFTFAESAYMSLRGLSWMAVAIGDPLYRPYVSWRRLNGSAKPSSWEQYRSIVLTADGNILKASPKLSQAAADTGNSMFLESLGAAQADAGDLKEALATVNKALTMDNKPLVRFRLVLEKFGLLLVTGKKSEAGGLLLSEQNKTPGPAQAELLGVITRQIFPPPPTPTPTAPK
ncbi:MAG: TIGR03790 family protein, partial [Terrimicrobiaceae bacterium]